MPDIEENNVDNLSEVERMPTAFYDDNDAHSHLTRVETTKSLQDLGLSEDIPVPAANYPAFRAVTGPEFPEEYTLETQTGLVPYEALEQVRSRRTLTHPLDLEKTVTSQGYEFVTFKIDDPENPQNWSKTYKWAVTGLAALLVVCVAYGSAIVTGGLGLITEKYNVSLEVANLTCSIMVLGFAVGPLLWSPLSEIIGRRPVYAISLSLYVIFNIPCALAPNIGALLVCRFLCGVFASSALSLAGGTIADVWNEEERGFGIAFFAFGPYSGAVFGPVVNGEYWCLL